MEPTLISPAPNLIFTSASFMFFGISLAILLSVIPLTFSFVKFSVSKYWSFQVVQRPAPITEKIRINMGMPIKKLAFHRFIKKAMPNITKNIGQNCHTKSQIFHETISAVVIKSMTLKKSTKNPVAALKGYIFIFYDYSLKIQEPNLLLWV